MYILFLLILLVCGVIVISHGATRGRWWEIGSGVVLVAAGPVLFSVLSLWGELLWFQSLGFGSRFWTAFFAWLGVTAAGVIVGAAVTWLLVRGIPREHQLARLWPMLLGSLIGGLWGAANWTTVLKFWYRVPAGMTEPIFERDVSFYLFTLPLLKGIGALLLLLALVSLCGALASFVQWRRLVAATGSTALAEAVDRSSQGIRHRLRGLFVPGGALLLALSWRAYLAGFGLLYSRYGIVHGPGWTDVHVRLPAYYVVAALLALSGLTLILNGVLQGAAPLSERRKWVVGSPLLASAGAWLLGLVLLPALFQWLHVQPNELTVEKPYIEHSIRLTREAFKLNDIEEQQFPVADEFTQSLVEENEAVLSEVRLWDPRALDAVYEQFQEIRLYYEFADVDVDRYMVDGQYREMMVSAREMAAIENLPRENQTFVNRRFKYTHGYGLTMAPVNEFTPDGLPQLLIKDLPPKSMSEDLRVRRPEIYYGEMTHEHVLVNTAEEEFDYPSGEHNVYNHYSGQGGVELSSLPRKLAFGWKFDGTRLLVSRYLTQESRVQFHRQVHERVRTLAPFLQFDSDAYVVLDEGKLYWIVDAYTTSELYPYSEPFLSWETTSYERSDRELILRSSAAIESRGVNYMRNSVKAVVDAFEGTVTFYVFEPDDPIIQVWQRIFPELFTSREEMPRTLRDHVRYPEELLLVQGTVYARYHMTDPDVFYNQEDIWVRATENYYGTVQAVEPYYIMWQPPEGAEQAEFIIMQPFTPKNRQVLIGWIAGMCDGENYGRLLSYRFPKEKRVLGTQQVETKIDQDAYLSRQLSLWDQRGSRVVRGNVLAIPVEDTLLYVEPIYLQAEAAAYPELRLVVTMHDDRLSYAQTFEEALKGLYGDEAAPRPSPGAPEALPMDRSLAELAEQAGEAFDSYLQALGEKNFAAAGEQLGNLSDALQRLQQSVGADTADTNSSAPGSLEDESKKKP